MVELTDKERLLYTPHAEAILDEAVAQTGPHKYNDDNIVEGLIDEEVEEYETLKNGEPIDRATLEKVVLELYSPTEPHHQHLYLTSPGKFGIVSAGGTHKISENGTIELNVVETYDEYLDARNHINCFCQDTTLSIVEVEE